MLKFQRYIGIDYSGAKTPTASLNGLRVYLAEGNRVPAEVPPPPKLLPAPGQYSCFFDGPVRFVRPRDITNSSEVSIPRLRNSLTPTTRYPDEVRCSLEGASCFCFVAFELFGESF